MKEIKAQRSSEFFHSILPVTAVDYRRDALTEVESEALYDLWKKGDVNNQYKMATECDRIVMSSLKYKGYITYDGITFDFTKRGKEVIKSLILSKEENAFRKQAEQKCSVCGDTKNVAESGGELLCSDCRRYRDNEGYEARKNR